MEHIVPKLVIRTVLFRVPTNVLAFVHGTNCSKIGHLVLFCSEFLSVNGTLCSPTGHLGPNLHVRLFCSEFLSANGTVCSQFPSVNGTYCSQIDYFELSSYL